MNSAAVYGDIADYDTHPQNPPLSTRILPSDFALLPLGLPAVRAPFFAWYFRCCRARCFVTSARAFSLMSLDLVVGR